AAQTPTYEPKCCRLKLRQDFSFTRSRGAPMDKREPKHQDTPRRELMEKMRQIEKDRLRSMNAFGKSAGELAHDNFVIKFGHGEDASDHPKQKYRDRRNPRPPTKTRV